MIQKKEMGELVRQRRVGGRIPFISIFLTFFHSQLCSQCPPPSTIPTHKYSLTWAPFAAKGQTLQWWRKTLFCVAYRLFARGIYVATCPVSTEKFQKNIEIFSLRI
jgi:hypothetical protein